ncbi:nuclear transport factor 2 family protein [Kitasatospora camelliae]|uniref:Nuclear transport factor 2 family protein n=1 Tax=Kitasatospora camelliae TaxID=3156397 RepID=A0AAU8K5K4_9ACTN
MTTQADHQEIGALVHRLFQALDAREFTSGWARPYFTEDARMETPIGADRGAAAVRAAEVALGRFDRTQHMASGIIVEPRGESGEDSEHGATARWNALMVHVHPEAVLKERGPDAAPLFTVGGVYEADLRRTPDGWRFSRMAVRAVWTDGQPPQLMAPGAEGRPAAGV